MSASLTSTKVYLGIFYSYKIIFPFTLSSVNKNAFPNTTFNTNDDIIITYKKQPFSVLNCY